MDGNSEILFEKTGPEKAVVLLANDIFALRNPKVREILEQIGLTEDEFWNLLTHDLDINEGSKEYPVFNAKGEKIEDVVDGKLSMNIGEVEVADVSLYPAVVGGKDTMGFHLKTGNKGGFEAIWIKAGQATISVPTTVEPVAPDVYMSSTGRDKINLSQGMLAIFPAATANDWSFVDKDGLFFRYLCNPPWSSDLVHGTLDQ